MNRDPWYRLGFLIGVVVGLVWFVASVAGIILLVLRWLGT